MQGLEAEEFGSGHPSWNGLGGELSATNLDTQPSLGSPQRSAVSEHTLFSRCFYFFAPGQMARVYVCLLGVTFDMEGGKDGSFCCCGKTKLCKCYVGRRGMWIQ